MRNVCIAWHWAHYSRTVTPGIVDANGEIYLHATLDVLQQSWAFNFPERQDLHAVLLLIFC